LSVGNSTGSGFSGTCGLISGLTLEIRMTE
jgi:hypothetical protein